MNAVLTKSLYTMRFLQTSPQKRKSAGKKNKKTEAGMKPLSTRTVKSVVLITSCRGKRLKLSDPRMRGKPALEMVQIGG